MDGLGTYAENTMTSMSSAFSTGSASGSLTGASLAEVPDESPG